MPLHSTSIFLEPIGQYVKSTTTSVPGGLRVVSWRSWLGWLDLCVSGGLPLCWSGGWMVARGRAVEVDSFFSSEEGAIRCCSGDVLVPSSVPVGYRVPLAEVLVPVPPWIRVMRSTYFQPLCSPIFLGPLQHGAKSLGGLRWFRCGASRVFA